MENIKEKIQKLLNLATSDNEHEAAIALAKATDLMNKWNLDIETVTGQKLETRTYELSFSNWTDEMIYLSTILFKVCDVYAFFHKANKKLNLKAGIYLSGRPRDIENYIYLFEFIKNRLQKESNRYKLSIRKSGTNKKNNLEVKSFRLGFIDRIGKKLQESKDLFFTSNKALISIDSQIKQKEAEEFLKNSVNKKDIKKSNKEKQIEVYDKHMVAGNEVAESIDLNVAVTGKKLSQIEHKG